MIDREKFNYENIIIQKGKTPTLIPEFNPFEHIEINEGALDDRVKGLLSTLVKQIRAEEETPEDNR